MSHVSLAMDPSLLAYDIQLPFVWAADTLPISNHNRASYRSEIVNSCLVVCHVAGSC